MNNQFLTPELCIDFKILGFREETLAYYSKNFNPEGEFELRFAQDSGSAIDWNAPEEDDNNSYLSAPLYQQGFDWLRKEHNLVVTYTEREIKIYKINSGTNSVIAPEFMIPMVDEQLIYAFDLYTSDRNKLNLFVQKEIDMPFDSGMKFVQIDMRKTALKKAIELVYKERYSESLC